MEIAILAVASCASALSALAVLMLKDIKRSVDYAHDRVTKLEVHVATNYIHKEDLQSIVTGVVRGLQ